MHVTITIGRVELRVDEPEAPPGRTPGGSGSVDGPRPALSLDEYLSRRGRPV
ncbi:hypothetical protein [Catenuloplanes japonicus]|uniref:hypothetical protein n=1 Tax=Catenuloplanes japonicus TaxID=33876 RepID=UPI0012FC2C38|nr:hypothetical protein [Catenuloplanes japonicus]